MTATDTNEADTNAAVSACYLSALKAVEEVV